MLHPGVLVAPLVTVITGPTVADRGVGGPVCETPRMRMSDFWRLMDDEFGAPYARSLARDHVLGALGNRTPLEAIESGIKPREVWLALCADMDVPLERRLGKELRDHTKEMRDLRKRG